MKTAVRKRFWLEAGLAMLTGALAIITLFWRDWIEALTGFDPDHQNGSLEWGSSLASPSYPSSLPWRRGRNGGGQERPSRRPRKG
jgi:hypothetical protein